MLPTIIYLANVPQKIYKIVYVVLLGKMVLHTVIETHTKRNLQRQVKINGASTVQKGCHK